MGILIHMLFSSIVLYKKIEFKVTLPAFVTDPVILNFLTLQPVYIFKVLY